MLCKLLFPVAQVLVIQLHLQIWMPWPKALSIRKRNFYQEGPMSNLLQDLPQNHQEGIESQVPDRNKKEYLSVMFTGIKYNAQTFGK